MNINEARAYFLGKQGAAQSQPFDMPVPVFKVGGKMFALINIHEGRPSINLKYPKDNAETLRGQFDEIVPGYHMNKSWWNTVYLDGGLDDGFIREMIDISYDLVFDSLTRKMQKEVLEGRVADE